MTDEQGHFALHDLVPGKTFVLAQHPGFRIKGWPVDPATGPGELRLTLVRTDEPPDRTMALLEEPIPLDQARTGHSPARALLAERP